MTSTGIEFYRVGPERSLFALLDRRDPRRRPEWLNFGAVYVDGRRVRAEVELRADQVVRLHTRPKRYPVPRPLAARVVARQEGLLVLDKPAGLPVHATLDNFLENAQFVLGEELGQRVYVTHRLDIPTQGLLAMTTTASAQSHLNHLFSEKRVRKIYAACATRALAPGEYVHYLDAATRVPRSVFAEGAPGRWECRLIIEAAVEGPEGFVHRVRLLTGKTHQIRAQFAALGAPLVGDATYGSLRPGPLGLACTELGFKWNGRPLTFRRGHEGREDFAPGSFGS